LQLIRFTHIDLYFQYVTLKDNEMSCTELHTSFETVFRNESSFSFLLRALPNPWPQDIFNHVK